MGSMMLFACKKKDCDPGKSGPDCEINDMPESVTVNSVELMDFPDTKDDGSGWDDSSSPDIFFKLFQNGSEIYTSEIITDVSPGTTISFTSDMPFNIGDPNDQFSIEWHDDDSVLGVGFTDLMGTFSVDLTSGDNVISMDQDGFSFDINIENNF